MNKFIYLVFILITITSFSSCKEDPWDEVADGGWNHERSILDIKFEGQAGIAEIENTDANNGVITLKVSPDLVEDMSKVKVEKLSLSYQANSSVKQGETIDFTSSSTPSITITSTMGESRTYLLSMTPFVETLVGTYSLDDLYVYGGTGPMYGGTSSVQVQSKSWCWTTGATRPKAECDNYLVFKLTEIMSDGNTTGECINYGGEDGKWWDCIFVAAQNKLGTGDLNLEPYYRRIPKGKSTWVRNYTDNTIIFTASNGMTSSCTLRDADTYIMYSDGKYTKKMTVKNQAFQFAVPGKDNWTYTYTDFNVFASSPRQFFIMVTKQADDFVLPEACKTLPE